MKEFLQRLVKCRSDAQENFLMALSEEPRKANPLPLRKISPARIIIPNKFTLLTHEIINNNEILLLQGNLTKKLFFENL